ncbi:unnamed protein product [Caenorhabditis sp. 36 PRJEB53466]|nr:unnamed protein product [Caenorhabditis sp. 36 PRJEB53466]
MPHLRFYPANSPEILATSALLKSMSDKLPQQSQQSQQQQPQQQQITPNAWGFHPGFRGAENAPLPFNYEEQNRSGDALPTDFDSDASRAAAPFMPHLLPRFGIPFPDFTDYQRFNGFQRNAFFAAPFGSHLSNPPFPPAFPLNTAVSNPMTGMESFNLAQCHHPLMPNSLPPLECATKVKPNETPEDLSEKPPVLSAEYPVKQENVLKFSDPTVTPNYSSKEEPMDEATARAILDKKKDGHAFPMPPQLSINKTFDASRIRDELLPFNPPFYSQPMDMSSNAIFKQEMTTPPVLDVHADFKTFNNPINGKRTDFQPPSTLHDCQVCLSTHANGLHFGARTCAACAAFFRRTISDDKRYVCKRNQRCTNASRDGTGYRKICRSCRMKRCLEIGMLPDNVQHKRNRRESGGSSPRKTTFDNFFTGFYPGFPSAAAAAAAASTISGLPLPPTDPHHPTN